MSTDALRIGIGATLLYDPATREALDGIGVYTRELMARFAVRDAVEVVPVVMNAAAAHAAPPGAFHFRGQRNALAAWSLATGLPFAGAMALGRRIDVFVATDYRVPRLAGTPVAATVFDAIPLAHPEWASSRLRGIKNHVLRRTVRWADRVFAISQAMVPELVEHFGISADRITVTPLGVDAGQFGRVSEEEIANMRLRHALEPGYLLFVGTLQPRKNVGRLLRAYAQLPPSMRRDVQLVLAGKAGWGIGDLVAELRAAQAGGRVRWLEYVAQSDLPALYQGARALAFPSLHEGFGLPVLEAFVSGTPVITSNTSSLPEVAGDAALLVDPTSIDAIAAAMVSLVEDDALCAELKSRGIVRAREFTWERCADTTLASLRSMT